MKLQRRQFLAAFGGILAELSAIRSPAVIQSGHDYINRRMGLAFKMPAHWNCGCMADMGQIQAGILLDLDDPDENARMMRSLDLPFVAMSPDKSDYRAQTLGIQFYLAEPPDMLDVTSLILHQAFGKPYKGNSESKMSPAMQVICRDRQTIRGLLHSFRTISMPKDVEVSGYSAAEYTATFDFRHVDLIQPVMVRQRSLVIDHDARFYLIRLIDTVASPFDFDPFVESVRLA